jgi:hypothetical protein
MKKLVSLLLIGGSVFAISCKKEMIGGPGSISQDSLTAAASVYDATTVSTKYGVLVNGLEGDKKITVSDKLGVGYVRDQIILSDFSGKAPLLDKYQKNGYNILLNLINSSDGGRPVPFPTNMSKYKDLVQKVLDKYKPEVAVIENEPFNDNRYKDNNNTIDDYFDELQTAIDVCHKHGVKVADGGLKGERVCILVYQNYIAKGQKSQAADFASRCLSDKNLRAAKGDASADVQAKIDETKKMIKKYKDMDLDYVNVHWYEPFENIKKYPNESAPGVLKEVADYLRSATGKPVITNEFGQNNDSPDLVTSLVKALGAADFKYAIDFSGDGKTGCVALNKGTDLKPNGKAYRDNTK